MECKYNLADVSSITDATSYTTREQVSQLEPDIRGCLHSTFNYPLHSTINFPDIDISMDFNNLVNDISKTITDNLDSTTTVKMNYNLRASDIKDSTYNSNNNNMVCYTNQDSKSAIGNSKLGNGNNHDDTTVILRDRQNCKGAKGPQVVLLPDQSYPVRSMNSNRVQKSTVTSKQRSFDSYHGSTLLVRQKDRHLYANIDKLTQKALLNNNNNESSSLVLCEPRQSNGYKSDNDSSVMSYDVDATTIIIQNHTAKVQKSSRKESGEIKGRLYHQTSDDVPLIESPENSQSNYSTMAVTGSFMEDIYSDCDSCNETKMTRQKAYLDLWCGPSYRKQSADLAACVGRKLSSRYQKLKVTDSAQLSNSKKRMARADISDTPRTLKRKSKKIMGMTGKKLKLSPSSQSQDDLQARKPEVNIMDRLQPEGMEDKENCPTSAYQQKKTFHSDPKMIKTHPECSGKPPVIHYPVGCSNSSNFTTLVNTNSSKKDQKKVSALKPSASPFRASVPTPSPWRGNKKVIKDRLRKLNHSYVNKQGDIETLGCF